MSKLPYGLFKARNGQAVEWIEAGSNSIWTKAVKSVVKYEDNMVEINDFITNFLLHQKKEITPNYIETEVYGYLNSNNLLLLLEKSLTNRKIRSLLPFLLFYCNDKSVTVKAFELIKSYKFRKCRKTLLVSLAHCKLSVYQLMYICELKICVEAFAQLLDIYLLEDCFTVYDLHKLLIDNHKYVKCIDFSNLFSSEIMEKVDSFKKDFLSDYISEETGN